MKNANKIIKGLTAGCLLFVVPVQATVVIDYLGQIATDGSGVTSRFIDPSNTNLPLGYFIETFDAATQMPGFNAGSTDYNVGGPNTGCAVNSLADNSGVTISTTGSNPLGVQSGSTGSGAAPANDTTCYGFTPGPGGSLPSSITIDYFDLLDLTPGVEINYLGFYFGSIDIYNQLDFYNASGLIRTITGTDLLNANGGATGNQQQPGSNVYVNLFFNNESFTKFTFTSSGVAAEFDNIVVGLTNRRIPEPAGIALLGLGLAGLTLRNRMKKSAKQV